jgi:hypothetical protein
VDVVRCGLFSLRRIRHKVVQMASEHFSRFATLIESTTTRPSGQESKPS